MKNIIDIRTVLDIFFARKEMRKIDNILKATPRFRYVADDDLPF